MADSGLVCAAIPVHNERVQHHHRNASRRTRERLLPTQDGQPNVSANAKQVTSAMEDYLKAIYRLERGSDVVPMQDLSAEMGVSGASVTNMLKRRIAIGKVDTGTNKQLGHDFLLGWHAERDHFLSFYFF